MRVCGKAAVGPSLGERRDTPPPHADFSTLARFIDSLALTARLSWMVAASSGRVVYVCVCVCLSAQRAQLLFGACVLFAPLVADINIYEWLYFQWFRPGSCEGKKRTVRLLALCFLPAATFANAPLPLFSPLALSCTLNEKVTLFSKL